MATFKPAVGGTLRSCLIYLTTSFKRKLQLMHVFAIAYFLLFDQPISGMNTLKHAPTQACQE